MGAEISLPELDTKSTIQHLIVQEGVDRVGIGLKLNCKYERESNHLSQLGILDENSDFTGSDFPEWEPSAALCEAAQTRLSHVSEVISRLGLPAERRIQVFAVLYRGDLGEHRVVSPRKN